MDPEAVERTIEAAIPDAEATVTAPRPDDDDHLAATVVSPVFEGESLIDQHDRVRDALNGHLTTDIHALKITTRTPDANESPVD
jgi:stress-induced morphogen